MATTTSLVEAVALSGHTDRAWHVSWHPTLDVLASCSGDRTVKLWAPGRGAPSATAWAAWTCVGTLEVGGDGALGVSSGSCVGSTTACAAAGTPPTPSRCVHKYSFYDWGLEGGLGVGGTYLDVWPLGVVFSPFPRASPHRDPGPCIRADHGPCVAWSGAPADAISPPAVLTPRPRSGGAREALWGAS